MATNKLTNANVFINGTSLLGKAKEVDTPNPVGKFIEHGALGNIGTPEFFAGFEKMEARIMWSSFYADVAKLAANPMQSVELQVRGNLEGYSSAGRSEQTPFVCFMTGTFKNIPTGNFKQHEDVTLESNLTVSYVKIEENGVEIFELDVLANIYKVDGVDLLADYRANLGL